MHSDTAMTSERAKPSLRDYLRYFLGLGTWGFGGPIATVGYMQRDLVERRAWIRATPSRKSCRFRTFSAKTTAATTTDMLNLAQEVRYHAA